MLYGVAASRQHGLQYTDGMCRRCAVTALQEWGKGSDAAPRAGPMLGSFRGAAGRAGIAVAAASLLAALVLMAAALRDGGGDIPVSASPRAASGGSETPAQPPAPRTR